MNFNNITNPEVTDMTKQYLTYDCPSPIWQLNVPKQSENEYFKRLVRQITREAGFKQGLDCFCEHRSKKH